ncbi:DUF1028 domain-containing protein [Martelella lutilitoris]|uniref:DUF1028 domain-containing protein n=1 Tax=Martelella lutilitoris TaxID=2583532 RepID=A0A5C4JT62_9HYPH|nr:DUF1028 domain-containing protein [Martelella lutilitoris]TNB48536.1 DUF1028 domain-containing protein [Martelella lutilitoris]
MTFSIVARCRKTGQFGMAISSSSPAVAARCAFARAGVGAAATQNVTNPALGPAMLDRLASGKDAQTAVEEAVSGDGFAAYRQLIAIGRDGPPAIHSGPNALGVWSSARGEDCAAGGNLLAEESVPQKMVTAFDASDGTLAERLISAMRAGLAAGGEAGPVHSAGLLVVDERDWPYIELRCDWLAEACPIANIAAALKTYQPQADDYVTRALNPAAAPSYGVPGDE